MTQSPLEIWAIILLLGIGTFLIRFSFLGLIGDRKLPDWLLRHLRYTPVAVLPALVAPMVVWPQATGGQPDLARMLAAIATLGVGYATKNVLAAIGAGAGTLYTMLYLLG
ncbi:AzlD domain-containing protein [Rhodovulum marinum]|uniref:Branched-subunit amino acid transport protein n=1 Tax=Rhodovulum marinum TaxID=320662 RepID=A0A4R2Q8Y6_9RHOB|nr:AzlD domain-containing protein [Rhodovulum marinum]TCP44488.1 branched-subunit amino acid transport protein [Rhodovulum marinum]